MRLFLIVFLFYSTQIQAQKNTLSQLQQQLDQYNYKIAEAALEKQKMSLAEKTFWQARIQQAKGHYVQAEQYFARTNELILQKKNTDFAIQNLTYQILNKIELRQLNQADSLLKIAKQLTPSSTLLMYHEALLRQVQDRYHRSR